MILSLEEVKDHLNLEAEFTEKDSYLASLLLAAGAYIENYCNRTLDTFDEPLPSSPSCSPDEVGWGTASGASPAGIPEDVKHAARMLVGHWWENRESVIVGSTTTVLELSTAALLQPHRREMGV